MRASKPIFETSSGIYRRSFEEYKEFKEYEEYEERSQEPESRSQEELGRTSRRSMKPHCFRRVN